MALAGRNAWSFLSSPSSSPLERASAVGELGGGGGLDLSGAFSLGSGAAGGGSFGGGVDNRAGMDDEDAGLSSVSPLLIHLAQQQMGAMDADDTPTSEDKGLALAQAGFAMAAGDSSNPLQNFGAGALSGVQALSRLRQQRALMRMRESQLGQQTALRQAALMDAAKQKQAALEQAKTIADEKAEIARQRVADQKAAAEARVAEAADRQQAAQDRADALAEQRYTANDRLRREQYQKSGQWAKIAGDEERGIAGPPPEDQPYSGPQVSDPTLPLKDRNKMKLDQPKQTQAVRTLDMTFDNITKDATALMNHPGLSKATGMGGDTMSKIPGTDAANFRAMLNSLKSKQFTTGIQAMRDASKTGGAVGNVSDREGDRFENLVASLDQAQGEKQLRASLQKIIDYTHGLRNSYHEAYLTRYGDLPKKPEEDQPGGITAPSDDDLINKYLPKPQ